MPKAAFKVAVVLELKLGPYILLESFVYLYEFTEETEPLVGEVGSKVLSQGPPDAPPVKVEFIPQVPYPFGSAKIAPRAYLSSFPLYGAACGYPKEVEVTPAEEKPETE